MLLSLTGGFAGLSGMPLVRMAFCLLHGAEGLLVVLLFRIFPGNLFG